MKRELKKIIFTSGENNSYFMHWNDVLFSCELDEYRSQPIYRCKGIYGYCEIDIVVIYEMRIILFENV